MLRKEKETRDTTLPLMLVLGTLFVMDLCGGVSLMVSHQDKAVLFAVAMVAIDTAIVVGGIKALSSNSRRNK